MGNATMIYFDTLRYVKTLKAAGMPAEQAEALAEAQQGTLSECMTTTFATKMDIQEVKAEIAGVRTELKAEIAEVRTELKAEIADVTFNIKILTSRVNRLDWMVGLLLSGMASLVVKAFFLT